MPRVPRACRAGEFLFLRDRALECVCEMCSWMDSHADSWAAGFVLLAMLCGVCVCGNFRGLREETSMVCFGVQLRCGEFLFID